MPRSRTIEVGAFNVKLHPHSPERYLELWYECVRNQSVVTQRGDRNARLGSVHAIKENEPIEGVHGQLHSFVGFDENEPWLNSLTGTDASDKDLESLNIPAHLSPSFRRYNYLFLPKGHRLIVQTRTSSGHTMGPSTARRVFDMLLNTKALSERYGTAEVLVEPEKDALKRILKMHRLDWLELFITRPNPDDAGGDTEQEVLKRLEEQNADSHTEQYRAISGKTLEPDEKTKTLAKIAKSNGYVAGRGRDSAGEVLHESTRSHPLRHAFKYNENQQSELGAFLHEAQGIARRLIRG